MFIMVLWLSSSLEVLIFTDFISHYPLFFCIRQRFSLCVYNNRQNTFSVQYTIKTVKCTFSECDNMLCFFKALARLSLK